MLNQPACKKLSKIKHERTGAQTTVPGIAEAVARGEAEIATFTLNALATDPRVDIVGPMPEELQDAVIHFGAVSSAAGVPAAAQALLDFLKTH